MTCCGKKVILLFCLVLASCRWPTQAQEPADSALILFHVEDLYYNSAFEYQLFDDLEDGKRDYLSLITCMNPEATEKDVAVYRKWIIDIAGIIGHGRFERLSEEKKMVAIHDYVTKNMLLQYYQSSSFDDLYKYDRYNFLTAACLYAFIMDELHIPYVIKESSDHLYLIAYPRTGKILVEMTIPEINNRYNFALRNSFINYLKENNLIDEITYRSKSTRDLFAKYFFSQKDFTLKELMGLQYMYKALGDTGVSACKSAYQDLQKAYYLYPSWKMQYMLLAEYYNYMENADLTNTENLGYFVTGPELIPIGFHPDYFLKRFSDLTEIYLFSRKDINEYNGIYNYIMEQVAGRNIRDELSFIYYYETGRFYNNSGKFELALDNLEKAFEINPSDKNMQGLFVRVLADYAATTAVSDLIPRLEYYYQEYKIEELHDIFIMILMHVFLQYAGKSFQVEDGVTGETYLAKFDSLYRNNTGTGIDQDLIVQTYSSAAIYYSGKGDIARSKQMILQGLQLAPGNVELQMKLDSFKN